MSFRLHPERDIDYHNADQLLFPTDWKPVNDFIEQKTTENMDTLYRRSCQELSNKVRELLIQGYDVEPLLALLEGRTELQLSQRSQKYLDESEDMLNTKYKRWRARGSIHVNRQKAILLSNRNQDLLEWSDKITDPNKREMQKILTKISGLMPRRKDLDQLLGISSKEPSPARVVAQTVHERSEDQKYMWKDGIVRCRSSVENDAKTGPLKGRTPLRNINNTYKSAEDAKKVTQARQQRATVPSACIFDSLEMIHYRARRKKAKLAKIGEPTEAADLWSEDGSQSSMEISDDGSQSSMEISDDDSISSTTAERLV